MSVFPIHTIGNLRRAVLRARVAGVPLVFTLLCVGLASCTDDDNSSGPSGDREPDYHNVEDEFPERSFATRLIATQDGDCIGAFDRERAVDLWTGGPSIDPTDLENLVFLGPIVDANGGYVPIPSDEAFTIPMLGLQNTDEYLWLAAECAVAVDADNNIVRAWGKARVGERVEGTIDLDASIVALLCEVPPLDPGTWTFLAPEGAFLSNDDVELDEEKMVFEERAVVEVPQSADAWDACRSFD